MRPPPFESRTVDLCPKRLWVLSTLTDDEALAGDRALPQGLRFHLSRCPACRDLADDLTSVTAGLERLAGAEPPENLAWLAAANRALVPFEVAGDPFPGCADPAHDEKRRGRRGTRTGLLRLAPYAAAAALGLAVIVPSVRRLWPVAASRTAPATAQTVPSTPDDVDADRRDRLLRAEAVTAVKPRTARPASPARLGVVPASATGTHTRQPPICRVRDYADAAVINDANCVHRAIVLPRGNRPKP